MEALFGVYNRRLEETAMLQLMRYKWALAIRFLYGCLECSISSGWQEHIHEQKQRIPIRERWDALL